MTVDIMYVYQPMSEKNGSSQYFVAKVNERWEQELRRPSLIPRLSNAVSPC